MMLDRSIVASSNNLMVAAVFKFGSRRIMSCRTSLFGESLKAVEALQQDCATNSLITTVRNSSTNFCGKWQFLWFLHCALVYFSELVQYFVFLLMEIKRGVWSVTSVIVMNQLHISSLIVSLSPCKGVLEDSLFSYRVNPTKIYFPYVRKLALKFW